MYLFYTVMITVALVSIAVDKVTQDPAIFVIIPVPNNQEQILPYFLSLFQQLNYPKEKLSLYIRAESSGDNTLPLLEKWLRDQGHLYKEVDFSVDTQPREHEGLTLPAMQEAQRRLIHVKEEALNVARQRAPKHVLFLDAHVLLTDPDVLHSLLSKRKPMVAPMMFFPLSLDRNFWGGMSEDFSHKLSDNYVEISNRHMTGCFVAPLIKSIILINFGKYDASKLTFDPERLSLEGVPAVEYTALALSAHEAGLSMTLCNDHFYGYTICPSVTLESQAKVYQQYMDHVRIDAMDRKIKLEASAIFNKDLVPIVPKTKFVIEKIYIINLVRRLHRKIRLSKIFNLLGLSVHFVEGVDRLNLNDHYLEKENIKFLPEYRNHYDNTSMNLGEVGCFLSHYNVWVEVRAQKMEWALVLEDDARIEVTDFEDRIEKLVKHVGDINLEWDLIYLGGRVLTNEPHVHNSSLLLTAGYTEWSIGYIINWRGAEKLIDAKPLEKIVPVDDFLNIMFSKHHQEGYMNFYPNRGLLAYAISPFIIVPIHEYMLYDYCSDTYDG